MSGPKTSRYRLTPSQRQRILEQQARELRIKEDAAAVKHNVAELQGMCDMLEVPLNKARELFKRSGKGKDFIESVSAFTENIKDKIIQSNNSLSQTDKLTLVKNETDDLVKKAKTQISLFNTEFEKINTALKESIELDVDKGFSSSAGIAKKPQNINAEQQKIKDEILALLNSMLTQNLSNELKQETEAVIKKLVEINNIDFLRNFNTITITPLNNRCKQYIAEYNNNINHFNELVVKYEALCETLSIPYISHTFNIKTKEFLEESVKEIEKQIAANAENAYIADAINEVMEEMGYTILGSKSVQKNNGRRFKSELFSFDDGIAVNVIYSSDGKITMELGGLDNEDRTPSSAETSDLCGHMSRFCNDYAEIEKLLEQKGVVLSDRISMLPPDAQYAQIINMSDYSTSQDVEVLSVKRRQVQKSNTVKRSEG